MYTRLIRNYPLLPPLLIGIISLLGIGVILIWAFLPKPNAQVVPTRTPTPFKYQFLATETLIPTPSFETEDTAEFGFAPTSDLENPNRETTPFSVVTAKKETLSAGALTATTTITPDPIFGNFDPLTEGMYDESDIGFTYIGIWNTEENVDAYQETVVVSDTIGDYVAFRFTGYQIGLGYIRDVDAGEITINIDGSESTITQQVGHLWLSDQYEPGTHNVIITHTGEGPINLDYIEIPE